jgi:ribonuclease E
MSNNKMLIDATHPEETRVVVLRGGRVEEFDFESAARKLLRGNIYLAKVTRVEPSLQAAFVEYGGNRHGFLAFNEIHPDYYQIPVADRQALIEEEAAAEAEEEAAVDAKAEALARQRSRRRRRGSSARGSGASQDGDDTDATSDEDAHSHDDHDDGHDDDNGHDDHDDHDDHGHDDDHDESHAEYNDSEGDHAPDDDGDDDEPAPRRTRAEATLPKDDRMVGPETDDGGDTPSVAANENAASTQDGNGTAQADAANGRATPDGESNGAGTEERVEQVGSGEDALEELPARPRRRPRSYKIQEVIKRRQVILVQVVKEERGNKGAALTTYLSLAGRYTVLMPNTARGGGISRKITNPQDRKRLKAIATDLEVPEGMGLIIRTAGAARTKQEIKRDFEYLLRLWESVRDLTLNSQAPSLVYEEGNLIKRSIRDLYNKDVDEVVVAGQEAYREAKDFMRMLMPSHAKNVALYQEPEPLFTRHKIESQLNAMFSPYVTLRSGGYLVINQTEALVAVDVNSGKSTREFSIEETALNTNLEAADEIARQLKLRDLAGLIVADFIDMEEKRNNRAVERRLKEALKHDRARIQVGRISHFGLLEMSRQRLRTGVLEGSTSQCPHCQGTGIIRSTESVALAVLRGLEDSIMAGARTPLVAMTTPSVALYILNNKRTFINDMETRHGMPISVMGSEKLAGANFTIEKGAAAAASPLRRPDRTAVNMEWGFDGDEDGEKEPTEARNNRPSTERGEDETSPRRKRRRRRRGGRRGSGEDRPETDEMQADMQADGEPDAEMGDGTPVEAGGEEADRPPRSRRRGRRGGRRGRERRAGQSEAGTEAPYEDAQPEREATFHGGEQPDVEMPSFAQDAPSFQPEALNVPPPTDMAAEGAPPVERWSQAATQTEKDTPDAAKEKVPAAVASSEAPAEAAPRRSRARAGSSEPRLERIVVGGEQKGKADNEDAEAAQDTGPARKGWWQRRLGG